MPFTLKVAGTEDVETLLDLASVVGMSDKVRPLYGYESGSFHVGEFLTRESVIIAKEVVEALEPELVVRAVSIPRGRMGSYIHGSINLLSNEWLKRASYEERRMHYKEALQERESTAPETLFSSLYYGALIQQAKEAGSEDAFLEAYSEASPEVRRSIRAIELEYGKRLYGLLGKDLDVDEERL